MFSEAVRKKFNTAEECHIGIPKILKKNGSFESHRHEPSWSVYEWSQSGTSASQNTSGNQSQKCLMMQERKKKYRIEKKAISVEPAPREERARDDFWQ